MLGNETSHPKVYSRKDDSESQEKSSEPANLGDNIPSITKKDRNNFVGQSDKRGFKINSKLENRIGKIANEKVQKKLG